VLHGFEIERLKNHTDSVLTNQIARIADFIRHHDGQPAGEIFGDFDR
jgi:hypothetical protein